MLIMAENAKNQNKGVAVVNGKFIGPPMVIAANKIIQKHKLIKKITGKD